MPNIPGNPILPGTYSEIQTLTSGVSLPGSTRLAVLLGEGARVETLIASANGFGNDGLNSTFTSNNGADGRHFRLSNAPIISNRTTLFRNGIPLVGTQGTNNSTAFATNFDYRLQISNGSIELQAASLVDQGGSYYLTGALNSGNGVINDLTLTDANAPTETWTLRCVSARRDGYGNAIDGYSKFTAQGSVSGNVLDGYGNVIIWQSNEIVRTNGILSFSIEDGSTVFVEGDRFTVLVAGGALTTGESLVATYIAVTDINSPTLFTNINDLVSKHGSPSLSNTLSLGAQLAFANQPPGIYAQQCAPPLPRRLSYVLDESSTGETNLEDLEFTLPLNVTPDFDSQINFFVTDPITGVETQLLPNKVAFYDPTITANPNSFVFGSGYTYSYTVILTDSIQKEGTDGVLTIVNGTHAKLSSASVTFDISDLSATRSIKIFDANNAQNNGTFLITAVADGIVTITRAGGFVAETSLSFQDIDSSTESSIVLFTDDLALAAGQSLRCTLVDVKDADFFDPGWIAAYEELEKINIDIVVPLPNQLMSQVFANGKQHVLAMSNIKNRKERVLFIGAIQGLTPANVIGTQLAAVEDIGVLEGIQGDDTDEVLAGSIEDLTDYGVQNSYGDTFRVVYFYPDEIVVNIGADRTLVSGYYISAAAAGFLSGIPNVAVPLTNKTLSGFAILRDKLYRPITLEQLVSAGITVLQPAVGGGRIIKGQTTTNSGFVEEQEISIIFIRDRVAKAMRAGFQGFIGQADAKTVQGAMVSRAVGLLNGFIGQGLISAYKGLKVFRDTVDPTQWNISVSVQPIYPINYVFVKVSIGLI